MSEIAILEQRHSDRQALLAENITRIMSREWTSLLWAFNDEVMIMQIAAKIADEASTPHLTSEERHALLELAYRREQSVRNSIERGAA